MTVMEPRPPRVGHKKSRNGCAQCKRRHVKCNEEKPCSNCTRHGVACSLAGGPYVSRDDARPRQSPTASSASGRSRRESQGATREASIATAAALPSTTFVPSQQSPRSQASGSPFGVLSGLLGQNVSGYDQDWMVDLQLLHHYLTNTQHIITETFEMAQIWHEETPKIAFTSEFVMHALLGLSALHKAHLQPLLSSTLHASAVQHLDRALVLFRVETVPAAAENAEARFIFTWLVTLFAYAIPPNVPPIDALTELFMLVKGIDTVLSETWFWVVQGPLSPILTRGFQISADLSTEELLLPAGLDVGFNQLEIMLGMEAMHPDNSRLLASVLSELKQIYETVLRAQGSSSLATIICFPRQGSSSFAGLIRQRIPQALVLLAYYTVLLNLCESRWWMQGWAVKILQDVRDVLDDGWRPWIQCPLQCVLMRDKQALPALMARDQPL